MAGLEVRMTEVVSCNVLDAGHKQRLLFVKGRTHREYRRKLSSK